MFRAIESVRIVSQLFSWAPLQDCLANVLASEVTNRVRSTSMRKPVSLLVSIGCGLLCAASVLLYTQGVKGEVEEARAQALARYGGEQVEVCVASRDIAVGEALDVSNVTTQLWLVDLLPSNAVYSLEDMEDEVLGVPLFEGEVLTEKHVSSSESSFDVPAGLSVLSIPVKEVQAVGGAVTAGSRVDVYATGASSTTLLVSNVLVVATSTSDDTSSSDSISWVSLAVNPESTQELVAASQGMDLYLVLP